eukprot:TRINITY_DN2974_c0_g1_i1.p1 TRINITY_DN2974_c0_g1~~TRINITY_DN2974_c0_g1_i1.p1  ORF type:complete len:425 (-),score=50.67 TRINITY_DN2974_c0_g1_i1:39-1313(-)
MGSRSHIVHLLHLAFSSLMLFSSFNSIQNLSSSFLSESNLGYSSIATIYISLIISAVFIGPFLVKALRAKYALAAGGLLYCSFIYANLICSYSNYEVETCSTVLYPTAVYLGIGASIFWSGQGTYLTLAAYNYANSKNEQSDTAMGLFNGIFFGIFQMSQIIGGILASVVLTNMGDSGKQTLILIYSVLATVASLSFLLLVDEKGDERKDDQSILQKVFQAILLLKQKKMICLVPVMIYSGLEQAFVFGNYTGEIITPVLGQQDIGYVLVAFGIADVLGSLVVGKLSDKLGSGPVATLGFIVHASFHASFIILLKVDPTNWIAFLKYHPYLVYIGAIVYGIGDSVWNTLPNSLMSKLFTENTEGAFSNLKFFQSVGFLIPFLIGASIPIYGIMVLCASLLVLAIVMVAILECCILTVDVERLIN